MTARAEHVQRQRAEAFVKMRALVPESVRGDIADALRERATKLGEDLAALKTDPATASNVAWLKSVEVTTRERIAILKELADHVAPF